MLSRCFCPGQWTGSEEGSCAGHRGMSEFVRIPESVVGWIVAVENPFHTNSLHLFVTLETPYKSYVRHIRFLVPQILDDLVTFHYVPLDLPDVSVLRPEPLTSEQLQQHILSWPQKLMDNSLIDFEQRLDWTLWELWHVWHLYRVLWLLFRKKNIFKEPSFPRPQFQSLGLDSAQSVRAVWILKGMGNVGDIACCDGVGVRIIHGYDMLWYWLWSYDSGYDPGFHCISKSDHVL